MNLPNLDRIVETHVPVNTGDLPDYFARLRADVAPAIRGLEAAGLVRWYAFLLHPAKQLLGHAPDDESWVIHIRLEPAEGVGNQRFIASLPQCFIDPVRRPLAAFDGPDEAALSDGGWAVAWRVVGASSEWVLCFLEAHPDEVTVEETAAFLHYISNPLCMGWQWVYAPTGIRF